MGLHTALTEFLFKSLFPFIEVTKEIVRRGKFIITPFSGNKETILDRAAVFRSAFAHLAGWSVSTIGAYFAYLRHPFPGRSGADVAEWLAAERGVLCLPGSCFGPGQDDYLRVAFANVDTAALAELADRFAGALARRRTSVGVWR